MGRAPCCDKANVKRGPWSPDEDAILRSYVERNGTGGNWIALPQKAGLKRCGKSCRLRWLNYLRPDIKHGGFTEEEDNIIITLFRTIGSRWSVIASQLPGRTDNDVKNYWNTKLKKKALMTSTMLRELPSINPSITTTQEITPMFPPLIPNIKIEDNFFDWVGLFSELSPLPMHTGLMNQPDQISTATPENSSAASSFVENWSTNGSSRDDRFLSEMDFGSYSELISGNYGQRVTYS